MSRFLWFTVYNKTRIVVDVFLPVIYDESMRQASTVASYNGFRLVTVEYQQLYHTLN